VSGSQAGKLGVLPGQSKAKSWLIMEEQNDETIFTGSSACGDGFVDSIRSSEHPNPESTV
jgi:hypothetical protein